MPHMIMLGMANVIKQRVSLEILHLIDAQDFVEDDCKDAERFREDGEEGFHRITQHFFFPCFIILIRRIISLFNNIYVVICGVCMQT